jgi:alpha-ketoglutarate-dependent taurine dioxygenase
METRPLAGFGVEVIETTLSGMPDEEFEALRRTVEDAGLVVARDQRLTRERHVELALRFGPIDEYDTRVPNASSTPYVARPSGTRVVAEATDVALTEPADGASEGARWRLDGSFKADPVCVSTEAASDMSGAPDESWSTCFANLQLAFDRLGDGDRDQAEQVRVWHSAVYAKARAGEIDVPVPDDPHLLPGAIHPLVRVHPGTGRKGLYIGENAVAVEGETIDAGRALLDRYLESISAPENLCIHRWEPGDVVIWDSRFVAHRRQPPVGTGSVTIRHISVLNGPAS